VSRAVVRLPYILNYQRKEKTARRIVDALSDMNGSDVLMGTQNSRNEKSPEASNKGLLTILEERETGLEQIPAHKY
jgi:hypothetical protein